MSQLIGFRLIIQRNDAQKNKYYVGIIGGSITHTYPFSVATASLIIQSTAGGNTQEYLAPISIDDIVRVQVNVKRRASEPDVWQDMFEGRIRNVENSFSAAGNVMKIGCTGHGNPLTYTYFNSDQTFTNQTTGYIVNSMLSLLPRFTDASPSLIDQTGSTILTEYTVAADGKTLSEIIKELEETELDGYAFRLKAVYDSDGNLYEVQPVWEAIGELNESSAVVENGRNLTNSSFKVEDRMINKVVVYGGGDPQVSAIAQDTALQATYDVRQQTFVDTSITTATSAQELADAILSRWKNPVITGTVTITGNPNVRPGDKVHCEILSISLQGENIDDDFIVRKVVHNIGDKFTTTLTLGELDIDPSELLSMLLIRNKRNNLNGIV